MSTQADTALNMGTAPAAPGTVARIVDAFGDMVGEITAPADGMFFGLRALPSVTVGDRCCVFCNVEGRRDPQDS